MSNSELHVRDLSFWVRLGCGEAERAHPQEVRISVHIQFKEKPGACFSDEIGETVCYAELAGHLKNYCESREFKTVEKLAQGCLEHVLGFVGESNSIFLDIHKVHPPVPSLNRGVVFRVTHRR